MSEPAPVTPLAEPQTTQSLGPEDAWTFGAAPPAEPGGSRRRPGMAFGALGVVLALVAGFLVWQFSRSDGGSSAAASISFAFEEGDTYRYRIHMTFDGTIDAEAAGLGTQPIQVEMTQTIAWEVVAVDADGVATVEVTLEDGTGSLGGQPIPITSNGQVTEMRIAPDGRILSAGNLAFSSELSSSGAGFPGMDQFTPLLPDHPVAPGDSWDKAFEQEFPFGDGVISFKTQSTFDRYEDVNGTQAAVISSSVTVPLDFTLEFGKLLTAMGGASGAGDPTAAQLADATITYGGRGAFEITSWVDLDGQELLRSSSTGDFDITLAFSGIPTVPDGARFAFNGSFTQDVERL